MVDKKHKKLSASSQCRLLSVNHSAFYHKPKEESIRNLEIMRLIDRKHKLYPYLLRDLKIDHPNYVWEMDIIYIPMSKGFMSLAAIIDVHSRFVVGWDISNTMEASWCRKIVEAAISKYGKPKTFNTDQGSQFTSHTFTNYLLENHIKVSMDGKSRCLDNVYIE